MRIPTSLPTIPCFGPSSRLHGEIKSSAREARVPAVSEGRRRRNTPTVSALAGRLAHGACAVVLGATSVATLGLPLTAHSQQAPSFDHIPSFIELSPESSLDLSIPMEATRSRKIVWRGPQPSEDNDPISEAVGIGARIAIRTAVGAAVAAAKYPNQTDKKLHGAAGGFVASVTEVLVSNKTSKPWLGALAGCAAAYGAGVAKEKLDATGFGHVDRHDEIATAIGGASTCVVVNIPF